MNGSWSRRRAAMAMAGALAAGILAAGCAGSLPSAPPPPPETSQLLAAGFHVMVATTQEQQQHLRALPQGKLIAWQRNGKEYYVYPVPGRNELYVGTPKEYEAYRRVVPASGPTPAQQSAADVASYEKQDAGMQFNTNRDLADPYYFWNSFDGLGYR